MEFRILGPLEVSDRDRRIALPPKPAALLVVLLLNRNRPVSIDRLVDELWGARAPRTAVKTAQLYVSQLRKVLPAGVLETRPPGYLIRLEPGMIDADRFADLVEQGRAARRSGDAERCARLLREALALWRGPALADFAYEPFAREAIEQLEELRIDTLEERIDADIARGAQRQVVTELEALVRAYPYRERFVAELMLALYLSGRQADALAAYREASARLRDELAIEPGQELRDLEQAVLRQDESLGRPSRTLRNWSASHSRSKLRGVLALGVLVLAAVTVAAATRGGNDAIPPNSLVALDPKNGKVVGHVPVGAQAGVNDGPGMFPTGRTVVAGPHAVWIASPKANTLTRVDPRTLRTVSIGGYAGTIVELAATPDAVWGAARDQGLVRIDPVGETVDETVPLVGRGGLRYSVESVTAAGRFLWLAAAGLGDVSLVRFDPRTQRPLARIALGPRADGHSVAVGSGRVWVSDASQNAVFTSPLAHRLRARRVEVAAPGVVAAGAGSVWVTDAIDRQVWQIDPRLQLPKEAISVGAGAQPVSVVVGGDAVWVSDYAHGDVVKVDPRRRVVVSRTHVADHVGPLAYGANRVWVIVPGGS